MPTVRIAAGDPSAVTVAELVGIAGDRPLVRLNRADAECVRAAAIVPRSDFYDESGSVLAGAQVVVLTRPSPDPPVVLGVIRESVGTADAGGAERKHYPKTVHVDGERIVLHGRQEIVLRCGRAEILLRKDGKVVVKGCDVVSRASGRNRIKGATVGIN